jgi:TatD DNase family protein
VTAEDRAHGQPQGRNSPDQIPRIAQVLAELRGISVEEVQLATTANVLEVLGIVAP